MAIGRPKGYPKSGGRVPGVSVNKKTQYAREILEKHNFDPIVALVETAKDKKVPVDIRIDCAKAILPYVYPRLAAVEVSGPNGGPVQVEHDDELMRIMMTDDVLVERVEFAIAQRSIEVRTQQGLPLPIAQLAAPAEPVPHEALRATLTEADSEE